MMPIVNPTRTIEILRKHNIRLAKGLGQHFLVDGNILRKIVDASNLTADDVVLEIGAGIGTLTEALIDRAGVVLSVEYDSKFFTVLEENFKGLNNFHLIKADALKIVPETLPVRPNKVVSNLPYNIASPLIINLLEGFLEVKELIVMIQKEVAKRITANPGTKDYGYLTLKTNYYAEPKVLFEVSRNVFLPPPKVDSAVIRIKRPSFPQVKVNDPQILFSLVSAVFGQRRKTIANALSSVLYDKSEIMEILSEAGIDSKSRGETLSLFDFSRLSDIVGKLNSRRS